MNAKKGGSLPHTTSSATLVLNYWRKIPNTVFCMEHFRLAELSSCFFLNNWVNFSFAPCFMNIVLSTCT
jgi:hypothetical protein